MNTYRKYTEPNTIVTDLALEGLILQQVTAGTQTRGGDPDGGHAPSRNISLMYI